MGNEAIPPETEDTTRKDAVASVAGHLTVLSTGEHAMLRRMYLANKPAVHGAVVKLLHHAGLETREYNPDYSAWCLVVHVAALLSGTSKLNPHNPKVSLGEALSAAGFSENRLLRLTAAQGEALQDQAVLAARILARAGKASVNLRTLLWLVARDQKNAERARIRIAQDYYSAAAKA